MEVGSGTGRQRRTAPFDFNLAKKSIRINSATQLAVTKLDVMFPGCARARQYEKMPPDARKYIEEIEAELGVKVTLIGTGPDLDDVIDKR
jgi:adenylosuccinate synthase